MIVTRMRTVRANEGQLYFLDKYMLFISKQPVLVSYADVSVARFERSVHPSFTSKSTF